MIKNSIPAEAQDTALDKNAEQNPEQENERKTKFGRPTKNESDVRSKKIKLSITKDDETILQMRAKEAGYKQLSRFIYDFLFNYLDNKGFNVKSTPAVNLDLVRQITGACNNLNQLTRMYNADTEQNKRHWGHVARLVTDVAYLFALTEVSLQGRDEEVNRILQCSPAERFFLDKIEVVINGQPQLNYKIAGQMSEILDFAKKRLQARPMYGTKPIDDEDMKNQLRQLSDVLIAASKFFRGEYEEANALFESLDLSGDANGNS
jgi:hypothetical protein